MRQYISFLPFLQLAKVSLIAVGAIAKGYRMECTANEVLVRIQYKCLIPFTYSQKRNCAASLFPKQNYNVLSPNFHIHVSVSDLYISTMGLPILLKGNMWPDPGNI
jgi:hypothetical protein